jgi:hypothetical protein
MGPAMRHLSAFRDGLGRRGSASAHRARLLAFGAHENMYLDNGTTIWVGLECVRHALATERTATQCTTDVDSQFTAQKTTRNRSRFREAGSLRSATPTPGLLILNVGS